MISVLNRLPLLNGNKLLLLAALFLYSCSPKVVPVKKPADVEKQPVVKQPAAPKTRKFDVAHVSLLLPFQLKKDPEKYAKSDVDDAQLAIDFYQGFKLAMDSVAVSGQDFKLNVIDSKAATNSISEILRSEAILKANLIVGPVFPESIKQLDRHSKYNFVSPLAATRPEEFDNPGLISMVPNINLHALRMSDYIKRKYIRQGLMVVLINPKNAESEQLGGALRQLMQPEFSATVFQEYTSFESFETRFQTGKQYVVLVTSPDKNFVSSALDKLSRLKAKYKSNVDVFGHPNWAKQQYPAEQLQALNVTLTSSFYVNYKRNAVISFVKKFRDLYGFEPSEYAFKGFDTGYYFAKLMAKYGPDYMSFLTLEKFDGLHNGFEFKKDEQLGYLNTYLKIVRYKNFQLVALD